MSEAFLGEIRMFGFNFAPRGWAYCDGQLLSIAQNTALFSLLGTIYGGDGRTTFGLPDLRGRVPVKFGAGPGLSNYPIGEKSGVERVNLQVQELPAHGHPATGKMVGSSSASDAPSPAGNALPNGGRTNLYTTGAVDAEMKEGTVNVTVDNAGGGQAHYNVQPFQAVNFCICLVGIFPSRS